MPALPKNETGLAKKLFSMADRDQSGYIQFGEFVELHQGLLRMGNELSGAMREQIAYANTVAIEKEFRSLDKDNNLALDQKEWITYMEGLLSVLGKKAYANVCKGLLDERAKLDKEAHAGDDQIATESLLDKAKHMDYLSKQHSEAVKAILDKKADPNWKDSHGTTSVIEFAGKCHASFMSLLLQRGGDASATNKELDCAVFAAARGRRSEVLRLLIFGGNLDEETVEHDEDPSLKLVRDMNSLGEQEVRHLVNQGADLNFKDAQGWGPLHSAVFWGKRDCVEALLRLPQIFPKLKLNMDMQNAKGRTALHVAARKGKADLIPLLIAARSSLEAKDMDGWTPLHHAVFNSMDDCAKLLMEESRSALTMRGNRGFTPYMIHESPQRAGAPLTKDVLAKLAPNVEQIGFAKCILPILKDESLNLYDRLDAILNLPCVSQKYANLRIYCQVFHPKRGPNKIQLGKLWELMGAELLKRLLSGDCDLDPPNPQLSDEDNKRRKEEIAERRQTQRDFVEAWLKESAGPPQSQDWAFDNREGYGADLHKAAKEIFEGFEQKCDRVYQVLKDNKDAQELLEVPAYEEIAKQYTHQSGAHPILQWMDPMDGLGAVHGLRDVKAFGEKAEEDDTEVLVKFTDLITTESDFLTPREFWRNIYKLWLEKYSSLANGGFQAKMKKYRETFNANYSSKGYTVSYHGSRAKSYTAMKIRETDFGTPSEESMSSRQMAGKQLDVVRGTFVASEPAAVVAMIEEFKMASLSKEKYELVQIFNEMNAEASHSGARHIRMNVMFTDIERKIPKSSRTLPIRIVGEIKVYLPEFYELQNGMTILNNYLQGKYEPVLV